MAKVCLDAGHYGKINVCPSNPKYYESEVMWKLHLLQKKYLEQLGVEVIITRPNQENDLPLGVRGSKSKGCDLFISNHSNAVGSYTRNDTVDYVLVYHLVDDTTTKVDEISKEFANKIAPVITEVMGVKQNYQVKSRMDDEDRNRDGILNDNYYGVLNGARIANTPAVLLEHSFHTNPRIVDWLLNDDNLDKLARKEAECIASYLFKKVAVLPTNEVPVKPLTGELTIIYTGSDGVNVRNTPSMGNNINSVVYEGDVLNVVGITEDNDWYKLGSGLYIANNTSLVKFTETKPFVPYMVRVSEPDVNIRKSPEIKSNNKTGSTTGIGSFTIVDEANGTIDYRGTIGKWGLLKSYSKNRNGWICLELDCVKKL